MRPGWHWNMHLSDVLCWLCPQQCCMLAKAHDPAPNRYPPIYHCNHYHLQQAHKVHLEVCSTYSCLVRHLLTSTVPTGLNGSDACTAHAAAVFIPSAPGTSCYHVNTLTPGQIESSWANAHNSLTSQQQTMHCHNRWYAFMSPRICDLSNFKREARAHTAAHKVVSQTYSTACIMQAVRLPQPSDKYMSCVVDASQVSRYCSTCCAMHAAYSARQS